MSGQQQGISFDDAWQQWEEFEQYYSVDARVALWRPRRQANGTTYTARVGITVERQKEGRVVPVTRYCQIGGRAGARTVPAALVRCFAELAAVLEAEEESARQLAAF